MTAGSDFPSSRRSGVQYGVNICNDANQPDAAQRIADQGARLILYPLNNMLRSQTADHWRDNSVANLIDRARQTGCWVASSDVAGTSGDLMSWGCIAIVTPEGGIVARIPDLNEGVVVYEIPAGSAGRAFSFLDREWDVCSAWRTFSTILSPEPILTSISS